MNLLQVFALSYHEAYIKYLKNITVWLQRNFDYIQISYPCTPHIFYVFDVTIYLFLFYIIYSGEGNGTPLQPGNSHGQRSLVGCSPWGR